MSSNISRILAILFDDFFEDDRLSHLQHCVLSQFIQYKYNRGKAKSTSHGQIRIAAQTAKL
jgi:hypothetical protein